MMNSPIIEFDVHGMRTEDAVAKVKRITMGANEGITELILREL